MAAKCLIGGQGRTEMLRAALTHWRTRKECGQEGAALLSRDAELRDWLATYT
jgi:hypothetical protein